MYERVPLFHRAGAGTFELMGLRGPMVLSADVASGALVSIRRAGQEIAGKTLDFNGTEVVDDVVTTDVAQLDVTVTGTTPPDEPEPVMVVLFAEDPARWHQGFVQFAPTTASSASRSEPDVRLGRMVPGRYLVVAVHDWDGNRPSDVRVLEKLRPLAVPVTLVAGETANVALRIVATTQ